MIPIPVIPWLKVLKYGAPVVLLLGSIYMIYNWGHNNGEAEIQAKWDKDKIQQETAIKALKEDYEKKESEHRSENVRITHELATAKGNYEATLARIDGEYASSLRDSEKRAAIYKRQAEGGTSQCRDLAGYAAQLDRSLEEGRRLVKEYTATIQQRDTQLRALGAQIINDRKLLGESEDKNAGSR